MIYSSGGGDLPNLNTSPRAPVGAKKRFWQDDDSDDEDHVNSIIDVGNHMYDKDNNNLAIDVAPEQDNNDNDLQWDSSPEQLALGHVRQLSSSEAHSVNNFLRKQMTKLNYDEDLTSDTEDDDVFADNAFKKPPTAPKLKRSNATRKRNQKLLQNLALRETC